MQAEAGTDEYDFIVTISNPHSFKALCEIIGNVLINTHFQMVHSDHFEGVRVDTIDPNAVCMVKARFACNVWLSPRCAAEEGGELDEGKAAVAARQVSGLSAVADAAAAAAAAVAEPERLCWSAESAQSFCKLLHTKGLQALQGMELSLCAAELVDGMPLEDALELFSQRRVSRRAFLKKNQGVGLAADENLVCKVEGSVFRWADLAPLVLGLLAFGEMGEGILQEAAVLKTVNLRPVIPLERSRGRARR